MAMVSEFLPAIFRWLHIFAGIIWLGHLYFFNFVNAPFGATMDGDTKKKVVPELMPRALFWFRWGALWTWATGVLLLLLIFYHGNQTIEGGEGWGAGAFVMIALTFLAPFVYDQLAKSGLAKNKMMFGAIGLILIAGVVLLMSKWAHFSYRSYNIHMGTMFGTIMAWNVWYRIWPAQQKIITAIKSGEAPNPDLVGMAGTRSRHNTYLSLPLLWAMMNQHSTYLSGGALGLSAETSWLSFVVITAIAWHIVMACYKKAGNVKGF